MASEKFENGIKIFTLNCWGLKYFSKHRERRIKLIADHLAQNDYDIVFLQEVWTESDFEFIRRESNNRYVFSHMFKNASLLGTSGLVIMAKWVPTMIHFYPFSINGSPFRITHGDWFSTKGVAYARIELSGFKLHLFCTHMHAQYDENESVADQYSVHRICQAYELAKYINLMTCNCSTSNFKDLVIMAGDMNTSSKEPPYRILSELTGLKDAYKFNRRKRISYIQKERSCSLRHYDPSDEESEDDLITCGHRDNTFTNPKLITPKWSKRIDFILYKLYDNHYTNPNSTPNNMLTTSPNTSTATSVKAYPTINHEQTSNYNTVLCYPEQLKISSKDCSGLSYSDHQPVAAVMKFHFTDKHFCETIQEEASTKNDSESDNDEKSDNSTPSVQRSLGSKLARSLKAAYHHANPSYHLITVSGQSPRSLLPEIEGLLEQYIKENTPIQSWISLTLVLLLIIGLMTLAKYTIPQLSILECVFAGIILGMVFLFCSLLRLISARHELNAVRAILNDLKKRMTFRTQYGLTS